MGTTPSRVFDTGVDVRAPLATVHHSHDAIVSHLRELQTLPARLAALQQAQAIAAAALQLFDLEVGRHHADEEEDLFPAVVRAAAPGQERELAESLTQMLADEHKSLEAQWRALMPALRSAAAFRPVGLDPEAVRKLVDDYCDHAKFEEEHFLPLADAILRRKGENHLEALGLAFHMRRTRGLPGYI